MAVTTVSVGKTVASVTIIAKRVHRGKITVMEADGGLLRRMVFHIERWYEHPPVLIVRIPGKSVLVSEQMPCLRLISTLRRMISGQLKRYSMVLMYIPMSDPLPSKDEKLIMYWFFIEKRWGSRRLMLFSPPIGLALLSRIDFPPEVSIST